MISPELKDEILKYVILNAPDMSLGTELSVIAEEFNKPEQVVHAILKQFKEKGLIDTTLYFGGGIQIDVSANAHDYILKGGHIGEFEYLEMQVQKLKNELSAFESSIPHEKYLSVQTTLNTIIAAASAFHTFK